MPIHVRNQIRILLIVAVAVGLLPAPATSQEGSPYSAALRTLPIEGPFQVHPSLLIRGPDAEPFVGGSAEEFEGQMPKAFDRVVRSSEELSWCPLSEEGTCDLRYPGTYVHFTDPRWDRRGVATFLVSSIYISEEGSASGRVFKVTVSTASGSWKVESTKMTYAWSGGSRE